MICYRKLCLLKDSGQIELKGQHEVIPLNYLGLNKDFIISYNFTNGGLPVAIVDETVFERLKNDIRSSDSKRIIHLYWN